MQRGLGIIVSWCKGYRHQHNIVIIVVVIIRNGDQRRSHSDHFLAMCHLSLHAGGKWEAVGRVKVEKVDPSAGKSNFQRTREWRAHPDFDWVCLILVYDDLGGVRTSMKIY